MSTEASTCLPSAVSKRTCFIEVEFDGSDPSPFDEGGAGSVMVKIKKPHYVEILGPVRYFESKKSLVLEERCCELSHDEAAAHF